MKTFTDSNTTIQQERHKNSTLIFRVEFWRQHAQAITSINAGSKQLVVPGDATGWIAVDDFIFIPLDDFETIYEVDAISYSSGNDETTITLATFPSNDPTGLEIAKRYVVSYGNTERLIEMSPISFQTEGDALNDFMAGDVTFLFDNGDGFFRAADSSGIVDSGDIFWVRIFTGYKNSSDRVLYFGGVLDLENDETDLHAKTYQVTAYSHQKTLERLPGYLISEALGRFLQLRGVYLRSVTAGSRTREGVKKLDYRFTETGITGIEITAISNETPKELRLLRFRFPDKIRYHDGDWTTVTEETDDQSVADAAGNTLTLNVGTLDVQDIDVILNIGGDARPAIVKTGTPSIIFDNGVAEKLVADFVAIYFYDGSTWTENTLLSERDDQSLEVFTDANDVLYFFSNQPFYGLDIVLQDSDLSAALTIEFSNGYNSWQTLSGATDGTSALTVSGIISWTRDAVAGWRPTTLENSTTSLDNISIKYGLRISLSSHTSGSATLSRIFRLRRLFAGDDTILDVRAEMLQLSTESIEEAVIIRTIGSTLTPCVWYKNLQDRFLLAKALTAGSFPTALQDLDELKITNATAAINIWGKLPYPFAGKSIRALYYDAANERLWFGLDAQLWYEEAGVFTLVHDYGTDSNLYKGRINRLAKDSSGNIQGVIWFDRYDEYLQEYEFQDCRFPVAVFRANTSGNLNYNLVGMDAQHVHPAEYVIRKGFYSSAIRKIGGQLAAGENIVLPFPQIIRRWGEFVDSQLYRANLYNSSGLLGSGITGGAAFEFYRLNARPLENRFYLALPGHYILKEPDGESSGGDEWFDIGYRLGNPGFVVWDAAEDKWLVYRCSRDSSAKTDSAVKIGYVDYAGSFTEVRDLADSSDQPLAGVIDSGYAYVAMVEWDDTIDTESKFAIDKIDLSDGSRTRLFDSLSSVAQNASQSIYNREDQMAVLDLVYNTNEGTEGTIHGCMLDRDNFEYHYFVYYFNSLTGDEIYSTQTGDNFTFDKHRQITNFTVLDDEVYATVVDTRYGQLTSYLLKAVFNDVSNEIELTRIDTINEGDTDIAQMVTDGTSLFGVTGSGLVWQYGTEFYPITEYCDLAGMNLREVISEVAKKMNMKWTIRSNRKLLMYDRSSYDGEKSLYEDAHIAAPLSPVRRWKHVYDGVEVNWQRLVENRASGSEEYGTFGWNRKVLPIEGKFVQDRHTARLIAERYGVYFVTNRNEQEADLIALIQLEELDRLKFLVNRSYFDLDRSTWWILDFLELDPETYVLKIKAVEA